MMDILLYVSTGFIIFSFLMYLLIILFGRNKVVSENNSSLIAKDMLSFSNDINIIESRNYLTAYNIKRRIIKIDTSCYYGNDLSSVVLSLIEVGIFWVDNNKNKYIDFFRNIFSNLKVLYIFPVLSIIINHLSFNVSDAKVSIIFFLIFCITTYIYIDIKSQARLFVFDNLKKIEDISEDNYINIMNYINRLLWVDKFILFGQLLMVLRMVIIVLRV